MKVPKCVESWDEELSNNPDDSYGEMNERMD